MAFPHSSSSTPVSSYDVYTSFHGRDVRRGFLKHLHNHFASKGIKMFDDNKIERNQNVSRALVQAIRESRIFIVVFSKNYGSSSWYLDELVEIFNCQKDFGQTVMTIFYDVHPSDVRNQKGDFGKAFEKICEGKTEEVKQRWSKALTHVATIAGEHSRNWLTDAEMIEKITTDVLKFVRIYDVFPSFHGEDVRKRFLSHVHNCFARKGIKTFKDNEIVRGHTIGPELVQAIRESRISIVVLSKNYASSSWCLDELVEIFNCQKDFGQTVMTIFYDVHPSDVRKQVGDFGEAFETTCEGKTDEMKQSWSKALAHVATIAGEHSLNWADEAEMIQKIATDVSNHLNITPSSDF